MRGSGKFCRRGSNFDIILVDEGREDSNATISGQSPARQRNAIQLAFRWRADDTHHWTLAWKLYDFSGDPDQYC